MRAALLIACLVAVPSFAAKGVRGYVTKRGTYVAPSYRTSADGRKSNNYSTKGNFNPYSGKQGTKSP